MPRRKKRLEKKRRAQESAWMERAEALYLQGEDEAFLASVRRRGPQAPPALATAYAEVRQRVLAAALAAADLPRIEDELRHGRVPGPAGDLAEAAVRFLSGDDQGALEALPEAEPAGLPAGLLDGLRALAGEGDGADLPAPARGAVASFRRLLAMARSAVASGRGTGRKGLEDPRLEAVRSMIDGLVAMRQRGFAPGAGSAAKLVAACGRMAAVDPGSATVAAVAPRAELLAAMVEAEKRTRAGRGGAARRAINCLEGARGRLGLLAGEPPSPAVAVHHALRRRLRRLLGLVAEAEGAEGLATLVAALPELAAELTQDGEALDVEAPWLEVFRLLDPGDRLSAAERADRVARLARAEPDPLRIAQLTVIEVEARMEALDDFLDRAFQGFFDREQGAQRMGYRVLERVGRLASESKRLPPSLGRELAAQLRSVLAALSHVVPAGPGWREAGEAMLRCLPGDPFLLVFAAAGARAASDVAALERLRARIGQAEARKARLRQADEQLLEELLAGLAAEQIATAETALDALSRLVEEPAWERLREHAAAAVAASLLDELGAVEEEEEEVLPFGEEPFAELLAGQLGRLEPLLGGEVAFDALRVVLVCETRGAREADQRIDGFLASHPGLRGALTLHRMLRTRPGQNRFLSRLAPRVVDSIEPGELDLWLPSVCWLAEDLDAEGLERLEAAMRRERELCKIPDLAGLIDRMMLFLGPSDTPPSLPPQAPRRRRPRAADERDDHQLKLF